MSLYVSARSPSGQAGDFHAGLRPFSGWSGVVHPALQSSMPKSTDANSFQVVRCGPLHTPQSVDVNVDVTRLLTGKGGPALHLGLPEEDTLYVVPECQRFFLYASPRAGLRH